ncbi:MAG: glycosyltransferase family 4 protein [candidate division WOR-3 bacterium]
MSKLLVIYLGSKGGGVLDSFELVRNFNNQHNNSIELSVLISENNPLKEEYRKLNLKNIIVLPTHSRSAIDLALQTIFFKRIKKILNAIQVLNPEKVLLTMDHPWLFFIVKNIRKKLKNTKIFYIKHNPPGFESFSRRFFDFFVNKLSEYLLKKADFVFTFSEHVRTETLKRYRVPEEKIVAFKLPAYRILCPKFLYKNNELREKLNILFFGRILGYKGIDVLVEAYALLKSEGLPVSLTIAGEGKIEKETLKKIKTLKIHLLNRWIPDEELCELLSRTDLVILPYTSASQSGPASIATGLGIPILATRVGGLQEQVLDNINGILVEPGNPYSIAQAIRYLLKNPEKLIDLRKGAQKLREKELSWEHVAKNIMEIILYEKTS